MLTSKNENLMVQFIGIRWVRSCDMRLGEEERDQSYLERKQQNMISILQELLRRSIKKNVMSKDTLKEM